MHNVWAASTHHMDKASYLTVFLVWDSSPHFLVQLMRPGIGWNVSWLCITSNLPCSYDVVRYTDLLVTCSPQVYVGPSAYSYDVVCYTYLHVSFALPRCMLVPLHCTRRRRGLVKQGVLSVRGHQSGWRWSLGKRNRLTSAPRERCDTG